MNTPLAGTIHNAVPEDFAHILLGNDAAYATWQAITPLARNEWLCWIGCIHRADKEVSPSVRGILGFK